MRRYLLVLVLLTVLVTVALPGVAADSPAETPSSGTDADTTQELDTAIDDVLARPEYSWRLGPRLRPEQDDEPMWLARLVGRLLEGFDGGLEGLRSLIERLNRWLRDLFPESEPEVRAPSADIGITMSWLLIGLALVVVCSLLVVLWLRSRRRAGREVVTLQVEPLRLSELAEEESAADQVEPQRWRSWALELAARGEFRKAVRAAHLAVLSQLARSSLIRLQRCKSNLDYQTELQRRCRSGEEVPRCFADNVSLFEQVWYGRRAATEQLLQAALHNLDRIGSHAPAAV